MPRSRSKGFTKCIKCQVIGQKVNNFDINRKFLSSTLIKYKAPSDTVEKLCARLKYQTDK